MIAAHRQISHSFAFRFAIALFLLAHTNLLADSSPEKAGLVRPRVSAASGILIDASTDAILWEKEADIVIPPASLVKLMTMHLALKAVSEGWLGLDQYISLSAEDCGADKYPGASLLFLQEDMRVTLEDLLLGMAVVSGNDAANATARALGGGIDGFVRMMNEEAAALGMTQSRFVEPTGLSELNLTTARDYGRFCAAYVRLHPQALARYHSRPELAFPQRVNMPEYSSAVPPTIVQKNRNGLLRTYPGCDGLKTGYIDESGYNIALSAERDGTRLVAVLLGGPGSSTAEGSRIREEDGTTILDWGFANFVTIRPQVKSLDPARVWKGNRNLVAVKPGADLALTLSRAEAPSLEWRVERDSGIIAPVAVGAIVGRIVFSVGGTERASFDLVAAEPVKRGNIFKVIWDSIVLWWKGLWKAKR